MSIAVIIHMFPTYFFAQESINKAQTRNQKNAGLHEALYRGSIKATKQACRKAFDINIKDKYSNTPLHIAAFRGKVKILKMLFDYKQHDIQIEEQNNYHNTALHVALLRHHEEAALFLLEKGASLWAKGWYNNTPLHVAARNGCLLFIRACFHRAKHMPINVKNTFGSPPLHLALYNGHVDVAQLLRNKKIHFGTRGQHGNLSMHIAVLSQSAGCLEIVLAQCKADLNEKNANGQTPLHLAVQKNNKAIVFKLLRSGAKINIQDTSGKTSWDLAKEGIKALIQKYRTDGLSNVNQESPSVLYEKMSDEDAVEYNDRSVLRKTVREGSVIHIAMHNEKTDTHVSPDYYNTQENKTNIAKTSMAYSTNVDVKDAWGYTSLHHAVEQGARSSMLSCLFNGADVHAQDFDGRTPLHVACYATEDRQYLINELVGHGACVNACDYRRITPLHIAACNAQHVRSPFGVNIYSNMQMLLALGADPNMQDAMGNTPLHMAARCGENICPVIQLLISHDADHCVMNLSGSSPVHVAVEHGNEHAVRAFLPYCAETQTNGDGLTPFHLAIEKNALRIVKMLAPYYDLNKPDFLGRTPLYLAAQNGSKKTMAFLVKRGATYYVHDHDGLTPYDMIQQNNRKKSAEDMIAYLFAHQ